MMTAWTFSVVASSVSAGSSGVARFLRIVSLGLGLALLPPIGTPAAAPQQSISAEVELEGGAVAVAPLLSSLHIRHMAPEDRGLVAGLLLVLFAGLSVLTLHMWREVGGSRAA